MSVERKLAWGGLLVGLVSLIPLFRESLGLSITLVIVLIAVASYLIYSEYCVTRTAMTTVELEKKLVIHDRDGKKATLTRNSECEPTLAWFMKSGSEIWLLMGALVP